MNVPEKHDPFAAASRSQWDANWEGRPTRSAKPTDAPKRRRNQDWLFEAQGAAAAAYADGRNFPSARPYQWKDPATLEPRQWLYGTMIQRAHLRAILGPGGTGKTGIVVA